MSTGSCRGWVSAPFVYALASREHLVGEVANSPAGVHIEASGSAAALDAFVIALRDEAPPLAVVEDVVVRRRPPPDGRRASGPGGADGGGTRAPRPGAPTAAGFRITASDPAGERSTLVSADCATCADCLAELADPADRRYRYPFINCTNCGPRFTIIRDVPYDRPATTMAGFAMCPACAAEYHDPGNRRFHAQPVCCPECGPRLRLLDRAGRPLDADPIERSAELLRAGAVLAMKGLGGYHLAVDARSDAAAARLRGRKHRADKPFAVMVSDVAAARELCAVGPVAERLLTGRRRPIVLLDLLPGGPGVARSVAPGTRQLGLMTPYTPAHHLLLAAFSGPLVLTSGNVSDEPIVYRDDEAFGRLGPIADYFLVHDRPIHVRADDSVVRVLPSWPGEPRRERPPAGEPSRRPTNKPGSPAAGEREQLVRRARGYAPEPLAMGWETPRPVLACGAELKSTFCLTRGRYAFVSQHIGDLENYETFRAFTAGVAHYERLFDVRPEVIAHDLHPEYLSTKYALDRAEDDGLGVVGVQHHHAHIASCLADNRHSGPVLGLAFDGLGYGTDGTLWGGEVLLADLTRFTRLAHLDPVAMPGGAAAIRSPWRMAAAYLSAAGVDTAGLAVRERNAAHWESVVAMADRGVAAPLTSSAGRLFDAVAAILDVRDTVNYEGQAAIELEQLADQAERESYPLPGIVRPPRPAVDPGRIQGTDLVAAVVEDLRAGTDRARVAARFHATLARTIVTVCECLAEQTGVRAAALSGGVFANQRLLNEVGAGLRAAGLTVLTHSRVPTNDGGISLGQAAVASAQR
ncbi:carbamoyltransferase HypF [Pseudofrankia inefficax]|uniref:Carbamoyltransferase n=1 Tax=Pseudofrankia inefficax (strain DSM 45817 / CECT 9037 / DDB 130130 / EuI1c) TaxID=298654 RepID=E3J6F1_PSEI1|nr:carbamoyltransferase HypF [Pseudofrankia inefficax]ADP80727.1 (NiFe) hydrogenase maturation protein HypF [Pseudofrankia inefficax]